MSLSRYGYHFLALLLVVFSLRLLQAWPLYTPVSIENNSFAPIRNYLSNQIDNIIPKPESGVFKGILFGIKDTLSPDLKKAFVDTSTIHIIVASGQNLTILSGFVLGLARFFGRKKVILASILINLFYCLLTGLQIPIIRAFLMIGFVSAAQLFNRDWDSKQILLITCLLMLIFDPNLLLSISFQLSFLATFAVMIVSPILIKSIKVLPDILRENVVITVSAQILTLPVIAANFHQISIVGILANAFILWAVTPIMFLGFIGVFVSMLNIFLGKLLLTIPFILTTYLIKTVSFFDKAVPVLQVGGVNLTFWIGFYFVIGGLIVILKNRIPKESPVTL